VDQICAAALNAPDGEAEAAIDTAASVLAASGAGREAAASLADRVLRGCRDRGWLPADLVRMARRELGAGHVRLAEDLASGRPLVAPFGFEPAVRVLELLRLLGRLPGIAPIAVPARDATAPGHPMLVRVRALLAKAESTTFPAEAEALSAKAQHLMARHSIDEALLSAGVPGDGPTARRIGIDQPYEAAKALLLDSVASANRCQSVWSGDFGFSTVIGYEPDLDAVELLYTSLLVQADRALNGGRSKSKNFRQSFLIAYATRIRARLTAATEEETAGFAAADDRLLPALSSREAAVTGATERMFPATTTHRLRGGRDPEGWQHGTAAADRARFTGPPGIDGRKA
jgi:hypothetical protein